MASETMADDESVILASALRTHLSEAGLTFTGLTGSEATRCITLAVVGWAHASGWRCYAEALVRYIDPPRRVHGGCVWYWSPPWMAYLDLRVVRENGPPIAIEIDREDVSTAVGKLRDEALRGHPALWIRWHGAVRASLPDGIARLHLPARSKRAPVRYSMPPVASSAAITFGKAVAPEAQESALRRDKQRAAQESRAAALLGVPSYSIPDVMASNGLLTELLSS